MTEHPEDRKFSTDVKTYSVQITYSKLSFPKSANVRFSQMCMRVISFLITLFEPWEGEMDNYYPPRFIYMVPDSVLHSIPHNHWEYCYIAFSHIDLCSLVLLSLSFSFPSTINSNQ